MLVECFLVWPKCGGFFVFLSDLTLSNLPIHSRCPVRQAYPHQLALSACYKQASVKYDRALGCCKLTGSWNMVFLCLQTIVPYLNCVFQTQSNTFHSWLFSQKPDEGNKLLVTILINNLAGCPSSPNCYRVGKCNQEWSVKECALNCAVL